MKISVEQISQLPKRVQEQFFKYHFSKAEKESKLLSIMSQDDFDQYNKNVIPKFKKFPLIEAGITCTSEMNINKKLISKPEETDRTDSGNRFTDTLCLHDIAIGMLSLAPSVTSGYQTCRMAGNCKYVCVGHSGRTQMEARVKRTILYKNYRGLFFEYLVCSIVSHLKYYFQKNQNPVIRLNGYSDIEWEKKTFVYTKEMDKEIRKLNKINQQYTKLSKRNKIKKLKVDSIYTIFDVFSNIWFYDYTKFPNRDTSAYKNYHLTFSYDRGKKQNIKSITHNICVVVDRCLKIQLLRDNYWKDKVEFIDGDLHDCRILDGNYNANKRKIVLLAYQGNKEKIDEFAFTKKIDFEIEIINRL